MTLQQLCKKDVIDIKTGVNYGRTDDLIFCEKTAVVEKFILHGRPKLFGLLGKEADISISWSEVVTIGEDAVLVDLPANHENDRAGWLK